MKSYAAKQEYESDRGGQAEHRLPLNTIKEGKAGGTDGTVGEFMEIWRKKTKAGFSFMVHRSGTKTEGHLSMREEAN